MLGTSREASRALKEGVFLLQTTPLKRPDFPFFGQSDQTALRTKVSPDLLLYNPSVSNRVTE